MVPAAVAMNSVDFQGAPACIYDGWCHVGCPIGALANPQVTYLGESAGRGCGGPALSTVTRVLTDASARRRPASSMSIAMGEKHIQPASVVVCATWAAQNPRLLLNSATDKHPNGLANASGLVGKYIMTHFTARHDAMFDDDLEGVKGTIGGQFMSYERYSKTAHPGAFGSTLLVCGGAAKASGLTGLHNARPDLFGVKLADFMKRAVREFTRFNRGLAKSNRRSRTAVELVDGEGRVRMPLARIVHNYDDNEAALWNANFRKV